jgi:hypothetical protein
MGAVKIAVSGAHSTGKTTFLSAVEEHLRPNGVSYSTVADLAIRCPLPILRQHTVESALWIVTTGIAEEIAAAHKAPVVLVDRPVLDAWAYLMTALPDLSAVVAAPQFKALHTAIKHWAGTYTVIYRTEIDESIPIEDNKGRDLDIKYRAAVGQQIRTAYQLFNIRSKSLTTGNAAEEITCLANYLITHGSDSTLSIS